MFKIFSILIILISIFFILDEKIDRKKEIQEREKLMLEKDSKAKSDSEKKIKIEYFIKNKEEIINNIKALLDGKDFNATILSAEKFLLTNDNDLLAIYHQAQDGVRKSRTKEILNKLKIIPAAQYEEQIIMYKKLVSLNPKVGRYKERLMFFSEKKLEKIQEQADNKKKLEIKRILDKLKKIPTKKYTANLALYRELVFLNPQNVFYKNKVKFYSRKRSEVLEKYGPSYLKNLIRATKLIKSRCSVYIKPECLDYIMLAEKSRAEIISAGEKDIYEKQISEYKMISQ